MSGAENRRPSVLVVDFGMGNLFSVKHACETVGLDARVGHDRVSVLSADVVILPGVGAFGNAMQNLNALDLVEPIRDRVAAGMPLVGICLGMQLLFEESHEFGRSRGLGLINGEVVRLEPPPGKPPLRVPHVGWAPVDALTTTGGSTRWGDSWLSGTPGGAYMYFVHSFHAVPADADDILSTTAYQTTRFCSAIRRGSVFATQFHPERSGPVGLRIYRNIAKNAFATLAGVRTINDR